MKITNLILSNDSHTGVRILVLSGIAWVPLVVLTLFEGTFISDDITIPFIKDVVPYVRGLIIIPLLVIADNVIEPMMARIVKYLRTSGVVPESEHDRLNQAVDGMAYLMNIKWIQLIIVIFAVLVSWLLRTDYVDMWKEEGVTSWALQLVNGDVDETLAGLWFWLITSPLVTFLFYRWIWRYIAWVIFLYRVSRLKLQLYASHTDLAGGLGIFGGGQSLFGIIFLVMATMISSQLANNLLYEGEALVDVRLVVLVFIVCSVILIEAPLLFFTRKLFSLKRIALADYGALQHQISGDFHHHWIDEKGKKLVDSMQPSAMADYSAVYEVVSGMRIVPLNPRVILILAVSTLILWQRVNRLEAVTGPAQLRTVALAGTEYAPGATGLIVLSLDGEHGSLVVDQLPELETDQQYQLWLIKDDRRVSGGVFSVSEEGYGSLWVSTSEPLDSFSAVGISIEPAGGSDGPTGEKVLGGTLN